jgi:hypothetical protein
MSRKGTEEISITLTLYDDKRKGSPAYAVVTRLEDLVLLVTNQRTSHEVEGRKKIQVPWFTRDQAIEVATALLNAALRVNDRMEVKLRTPDGAEHPLPERDREAEAQREADAKEARRIMGLEGAGE